MRFCTAVLGVIGLCTISGVAYSPTHLECQLQKPPKISPLFGCAPGTLFVSPTDKRAHFKTVQSAVESLPEKGKRTILIGEGSYMETVNVTRSGPLTLLGQIAHGQSPSAPNLVQIYNSSYLPKTAVAAAPYQYPDDVATAVLIVSPSLNASYIGAGPVGAPLQPLFGNKDFKAYNIDFSNLAANYSIAQALVTDISYANASFYGCNFKSYQDTWYTGRNASTYVFNSTIYGATDYLFGFGTAWFEKVTLANRACGGGIAVWKGSNTTEGDVKHYGAYISNSRVIRSPDANATTVTEGACYLGRPWNPLATSVFLRTYLSSDINPAGWIHFSLPMSLFGIMSHKQSLKLISSIPNTTFYAEYDNYGPGANTTQRVDVEHILTAKEAKNITIDGVFQEQPKWIDLDYRMD